MLSKFGPAPWFFTFEQSFFCLFQLQKTLHKVRFLQSFLSWIRIRCKKAWPGSAINVCRSTALGRRWSLLSRSGRVQRSPRPPAVLRRPGWRSHPRNLTAPMWRRLAAVRITTTTTQRQAWWRPLSGEMTFCKMTSVKVITMAAAVRRDEGRRRVGRVTRRRLPLEWTSGWEAEMPTTATAWTRRRIMPASSRASSH